MADEDGRADDGDHGDDDVDAEVPAPVEVFGEVPAEEQAHGTAGAGDRAEHTEGTGAFLGNREGRRQHREGGRGEQCAECSLQGAGSDQHAEAVGRSAQRRRDGESDQTDDEGAFAADQVGEATAEQQQTTEGEGVGSDDPLAVAVGEAEVGLGRR